MITSLSVANRYRVNRHNETYVFLMDDGVCELVVNNERMKWHGYNFSDAAWGVIYQYWEKSNYMEFEQAKARIEYLREQRESQVYGGELKKGWKLR